MVKVPPFREDRAEPFLQGRVLRVRRVEEGGGRKFCREAEKQEQQAQHYIRSNKEKEKGTLFTGKSLLPKVPSVLTQLLTTEHLRQIKYFTKNDNDALQLLSQRPLVLSASSST